MKLLQVQWCLGDLQAELVCGDAADGLAAANVRLLRPLDAALDGSQRHHLPHVPADWRRPTSEGRARREGPRGATEAGAAVAPNRGGTPPARERCLRRMLPWPPRQMCSAGKYLVVVRCGNRNMNRAAA